MKKSRGNISDRPQSIFGWRILAGLSIAAALLTGGVFIVRDTRYFHSLFSLHALLAALPVICLVAGNASGMVYGRRLALLSLAIYCVALAVPALRLANDLTLGYSAFVLSFVGIGLFSEWGSSGERFWYPIACTMGALGNISFIVGYFGLLGFVIWKKGIRLARWSAALGSCFSLFVILPLALSTELNGVYIGYGLWVTGFLALAIGSWRMQSTGLQTTGCSQDQSQQSADHLTSGTIHGGRSVIVLLVGFLAIAAVALNHSRQRSRVAQKQTDERIVDEVTAHIRQYLFNLRAKDDITQIYGPVKGLSFGAYERRNASRGIVRTDSMLIIECVAQFEECNEDLKILVYAGDSLEAHARMEPDIRWLKKWWGKGYYTEVHDSRLYVIPKDGEAKPTDANQIKRRTSPEIRIVVNHPDFQPG